jgi:hypothetical protein
MQVCHLRVDIYFVVVRLFSKHFRCHKTKCAYNCLSDGLIMQKSRLTKISNLCLSFSIKQLKNVLSETCNITPSAAYQDICTLQITMNCISSMKIGKSRCNIMCIGQDCSLFQLCFLFVNQVIEGAIFGILHNQRNFSFLNITKPQWRDNVFVTKFPN